MVSEVVTIWYKDIEWTNGEWGVHRQHEHIFDTNWSVWTDKDRMALEVIREWGIARVLWVDCGLVNNLARKVRKDPPGNIVSYDRSKSSQ